jgi:hypothetical protein
VGEELGLKEEETEAATYLKKYTQKKHKNNFKKSKNSCKTDEEHSEDTFCVYCLVTCREMRRMH